MRKTHSFVHGSGPAWGGLAAALAASASISASAQVADLIYDPITGQVAIDPNGVSISIFALSAPNPGFDEFGDPIPATPIFRANNALPQVNGLSQSFADFAALDASVVSQGGLASSGLNANNVVTVGWSSGSLFPTPQNPTIGFTGSDPFGIGAILPTGLDLSGFSSLFGEASYATDILGVSDDFNFVVQPSLLGDFDLNGLLELADLEALYDEVRAGTNDENFDLSDPADSAVDGEDLRIWTEDLFGSVLGDLDLDGDVDIVDFGEFAQNFGTNVEDYALGDLDGDGDNDIVDFGTFALNFGFGVALSESDLEAFSTFATFAEVTAPEPTSLALLGLGGGLALRRRKV